MAIDITTIHYEKYRYIDHKPKWNWSHKYLSYKYASDRLSISEIFRPAKSPQSFVAGMEWQARQMKGMPWSAMG